MLANRRTRLGFTLAEVLVTIAIIAIMAAVLLPALNNQLSKGDTSRIASDLVNIQSGVQAFVSDLRHYPQGTDQLVTTVTSSTSDILGTKYTVSDVAAWKGPYVSRDVLANTGGRATFSSTFATTTTSSTKFLTIIVSPVSATQFASLEAALDEGTSNSSTSGAIRYDAASSTLNFLAMPIQ